MINLKWKLFTIQCIIFLSTVNVLAQNTKIDLSLRNVPLKDFIATIEQTTDYTFMLDNTVDQTQQVSVEARQETMENVLTQVLGNKGIAYDVTGTRIILKKAPPAVVQQTQKISGVIKDNYGEPIIGANVVEKGTTNGTITDFNGEYSLNVPANAVLRVSYIGYVAQDVPVNNRTVIELALMEDSQSLDEVVVIGYGTVRKSDLTGSVSSIKSDELKKTPVTSLDQAIQGKAAGVQVTQASSAPGGRVSIRVRGGNSLSSSNEPLYVIDGYPISGGESAGGSGVGQNPLATINTSDIASIEILKDASATAIYGARGANGVVLITTKRGNIGKPQISLDAYYGFQTVAKKLDMLNAYEYATLVNEAYANYDESVIFPSESDPYNFRDPSYYLNNSVDWQDEVFTTAPTQNYNLSIAGGSESMKYAFSGSYFGQDGVIKNSDFNRASFRSNMDMKLASNFSINTNMSASHVWGNATTSEGDGGNSSAIVWATVVMPPTVPIYQEDGTYTMRNTTPGGTPTPNPVAIANHLTDQLEISRFLGSMDFNWEIIKNLTLKVTFGADVSVSNRSQYIPTEINQGKNAGGIALQQYRKNASYLNENILTYMNRFGDHSINLMGGYTWQVFHRKDFRAGSSGYVTDLYKADNLGAGSVYSAPESNRRQNQLASYLGRINYSFKDRYLITLTGRADGSSKFGANNKWAFFPSAALAWRITEEEFMEPFDFVSNLKLRLSYGQSGNQDIDPYKSLANLAVRNYPFNDDLVSGTGPDNIPNPDLKWETTATTDVGVDIGLFDNRLSLVVDYYYKKTTDLLWNISMPGTTGFSSMFRNIGSMENKGLEIALGGDIMVSEFTWNTQLNWSRNRNKVLEIPGYTPAVQGSLSGHLKVNGSWLEPGLPVGVWNLLKYDGVFQNEEQLNAGPKFSENDQLGDPRFIDKNGDGVISYTEDRMIVGDPNPNFIYGWTNNFSYKGFDLSIYIQGSQGNDIINVQRAETNVSGPWGNQRREILNRWTPENPNTNIPRATPTVNANLVQSSWLIEDGSYMRVKTLTLGYTFYKIKFMNSLRIYATGHNLFTITNYSGYDPEVNSQGNNNIQIGVDYNAYPSAKSFIFGFNATF